MKTDRLERLSQPVCLSSSKNNCRTSLHLSLAWECMFTIKYDCDTAFGSHYRFKIVSQLLNCVLSPP